MRVRGVDFVRNNMSHSSLEDLQLFMEQARAADLPFILDTEGSQVRTGVFANGGADFPEGQAVELHSEAFEGDVQRMTLTPGFVIPQLEVGDVVHIDFDALILLVTDTSPANAGYVRATAINGGFVGNRKAVYIDRVSSRHIVLPTLSPKDFEAIEIALDGGVETIAASFVRSGGAVRDVREATRKRMKIISKVECIEALENLDEIIEESDLLLMDRGDMSKEIPIDKIPYAQKIILDRAGRQDTGVVVATNLLETMIEKSRPTRAEVNDILNTIQDGAVGLTLAAETAIGKHPIQCINMLNKVIAQAQASAPLGGGRAIRELTDELTRIDFLFDHHSFSTLAQPHGGGLLVDRVLRADLDPDATRGRPQVALDEGQQMDLRQIATGAYTPIEGFLGKADLECVLRDMRLTNGAVWPLPIALDVSVETAQQLTPGQAITLVDADGIPVASMDLAEVFEWDRAEVAAQLYGTNDPAHPGVAWLTSRQPMLLGGAIQWIPRPGRHPEQAFELTPRQVRKLFEERCWSRVVAFHTRNIPHRAHEFIQKTALREHFCDGLFVHPVVGKKKVGDFESSAIIACHQRLIRDFYPRGSAVFATFATFSRYAGPREAIFTALCRKNFGCSHIIIGRDHTGVGDYYEPHASQEIFERFPDLGIEIIPFGDVRYSAEHGEYFQADGGDSGPQGISGSELRQLFQAGKSPAEWMLRPEISEIVLDALARGEKVFVER